jgi:multidrug efflux pump
MEVIDVPEFKVPPGTKMPDGTVTQDSVNFLVNSVIAQVGEGTSDPAEGGMPVGATPNKGRVAISFVKFADRHGLLTTDVLRKLQHHIKAPPGVVVTVAKNADGPPVGKPINIEIKGKEIEGLLAEAERVKAYIESKNVPGVEALRIDIDRAKPEMPITIDREKARRLNVSTYAIADAIRTALFGKEVSNYRVEGDDDDHEVNVRLNDAYRYDPQALMNMKVTFRDMVTGQIRQVPISAMATAERSSSYSAIKRKDLDRVVTISSNVLSGYNGNEVVQQIKDQMASGFSLGKEFNLKFTGEQEDQAKDMGFLMMAFLVAIFVVFLIIVAQFNSISYPLIVMSTVIFSTIGVFLGLVVFRMDFIILMTMLGIISLIGVVVNNAIVLMDFARLLFRARSAQTGAGRACHHPHRRKPRGPGDRRKDPPAPRAAHRFHRRAGPAALGRGPQLQLLHPLHRAGPAHPHGRRQRDLLGPAQLGRDLRTHLRHLPHPDHGARDAADRDEDQAQAPVEGAAA